MIAGSWQTLAGSALGLALAFALVGCVVGPVKGGEHTTRELQSMGEDEGAKLAAIATRSTLARYDGALADVWRVWTTGEAGIRARKPSGPLTPEQAQQWADAIASVLLRAALVRDNKLATLDRRRAAELEQIQTLHRNQIAAVNGIVAGWAAQGEVTSGQYRAWLGVFREGAAFYVEQKHIREVREEAAEAARREAEAAEHGEE